MIHLMTWLLGYQVKILGLVTSRIVDPGAVHVIYGSAAGLSLIDQFWTQDSADIEDVAETENFFGGSLSSGDYNGDGHDDLAIGVSWEDIDSTIGAGAIHVIYGSATGLSSTTAVLPDQLWTQDSTNLEDVAEANNHFGHTLSSGDYNGDGRDDLAVGVPWEGIGSIVNAGAVHIIYGSASGLSATAVLVDQFWTQDSANIQDVVEADDILGWSLSSGDYNGDGRDDLAVGVTDEDFNNIVNAGAVHIIYGSSTGLSATAVLEDQFWTQDSTNIEGVAEAGDDFGSTL